MTPEQATQIITLLTSIKMVLGTIGIVVGAILGCLLGKMVAGK